jgi:hypothetical protein
MALVSACGITPEGSSATNSDALDAPRNLLQNWSFEDGLSPWSVVVRGEAAGANAQDETTAADGTSSERVDVWSATPSVPWNVQLQQTGLSLAAGQEVTVSLWAKGATPQPIDCVLQANRAPWTAYASQGISVTRTWTKFQFTFTPDTTDADVLFALNFGAAADSVWVDAVSVVSSTGAAPLPPPPPPSPPPPPDGGAGTGAMPPPQAAGYHLAFSDEFDSLDLSPSGTGNHTWYNTIWYEPVAPFANISAHSSILHLSWTRGQSPADTSITTDARDGSSFKAWRYGYFEARMRWDVALGAWPAFWLVPRQDRSAPETGEIDIFEGQGDTPHTYYGTLHDWRGQTDVWNTNGANAYQTPSTVDFSQFHTYGVLWTPGKVVWYLDEKPILQSPTTPIFDSQDFYLILGAQEGQNWQAGDLSGVTANRMGLDVDWVRVWQR